MAMSDKKNLMGYDPLAWMGEEIETTVLEELNEESEVMQEQLIVDEINADSYDPTSLSNSVDDQEFLEPNDNEIEMSTSANIAEEQVLNPALLDKFCESTVSLDSTLTIQHVVKLYETLKQSYASNNKIEINASQVSSIDTASLQLLVALKKNAVKQQKAIIFASPSQRFIESAELLGLLEVLEIDV
jgi:anti-anti-sigma regulatory factor